VYNIESDRSSGSKVLGVSVTLILNEGPIPKCRTTRDHCSHATKPITVYIVQLDFIAVEYRLFPAPAVLVVQRQVAL
jgi:hypothetical protein